MKLDARHLEILAAIVDGGGLTEGAEAVGRAQPSVSRTVAMLEARIGAPLFEKNRRPLVPTELCLGLAAEGRRILAAGSTASAIVATFKTGHRGVVRIGGTPVFIFAGQSPWTTRGEMLGQFDNASRWLTLADSYQRRGDTQSGAEILQSALRQSPRDADLWVGLGNALVVHSGGMMSPAAQLAFARAQRIAPDHPGPRFFYGLALAQGGNFDQAEQIWRQLLAEAPPDAEYRTTIQERLDSLQQARAMGQIPGGPAPQSAPPPTAPATR